jgi:hypothetical protein
VDSGHGRNGCAAKQPLLHRLLCRIIFHASSSRNRFAQAQGASRLPDLPSIGRCQGVFKAGHHASPEESPVVGQRPLSRETRRQRAQGPIPLCRNPCTGAKISLHLELMLCRISSSAIADPERGSTEPLPSSRQCSLMLRSSRNQARYVPYL